MNFDNNDRHDELPAAAVMAINRIRNLAVPDDAIERALNRAMARNWAPADDGPQSIEAAAMAESNGAGSSIGAVHRAGGQGTLPDGAMRMRFAKWAVAVAAPVLLLTVSWFAMRPQMAWSDVIETVQEMPWMRLTAADDDVEKSESWYSPTRKVMATRHGENATFVSIADGERLEFDAVNGTLCRLPLDDMNSPDTLATVRHLMTAGAVETGSDLFGFKVIGQESRTVDDGAAVWREFVLKLKRYSNRMTMVVRVDPNSKLPVWMEFTHTSAEQNTSRRYDIDYPSDGPADIYALGVSRELKMVDRIPSTDLRAVLAKLTDGYQSFGDYSAIVCNECGVPYRLIRRSGEKWRFDRCLPTDRTRPLADSAEQIVAHTNDDQWWQDRLAQYDLEPLLICDGEFVYRFDNDDELPGHHAAGAEITADTADKRPSRETHPPNVVRRVPQAKPAGPTRGRRGGRLSITGMVDTYRLIVESFAYPPLRSSSEFELSLNPAGNKGPEGTVLLEVKAVVPPDPSLMCRHWKLWLDPDKNYAAVRHEIIGFSELGDSHDPYAHLDQTNQIREFDVFRKTPDGYYYPTVVRWMNVSKKTDDGPPAVGRDLTTFFHLDFETDVSDRVFDPYATDKSGGSADRSAN